MDLADLTPGTKVVIIDPRLNCGSPDDVPCAMSNPNAPYGKEGVVVLTQEVPGKLVGIYLKEPWEHARELDGRVPRGHGWWTRPEYLYTAEEHSAHKANAEKWQAQLDAAKQLMDVYNAAQD